MGTLPTAGEWGVERLFNREYICLWISTVWAPCVQIMINSKNTGDLLDFPRIALELFNNLHARISHDSSFEIVSLGGRKYLRCPNIFSLWLSQSVFAKNKVARLHTICCAFTFFSHANLIYGFYWTTSKQVIKSMFSLYNL